MISALNISFDAKIQWLLLIALIGLFLLKKFWYVTLIIGLSFLALGAFLILAPKELSVDLTCKLALPKNIVVCDFWESDDIGLRSPKHYQFELYFAFIAQDRDCDSEGDCWDVYRVSLQTSIGDIGLTSFIRNQGRIEDLRDSINDYVSNPEEFPLTYQEESARSHLIAVIVFLSVTQFAALLLMPLIKLFSN